jgi:hypothetical protein
MSGQKLFDGGGRGLVVGATALALGLGPLAGSAGAGRPAIDPQVRLEDPRDGVTVTQAVLGALDRLEDARCRALFSEFMEPSGRRLQEVLDAGGETAQSRLRSLLFYDGSRLSRSSCRPPSPMAFTVPGSRVIFVCGRELRSAAERSRALADAVIIHELLHSVGLGENPPAPKAITDAVLARCAR